MCYIKSFSLQPIHPFIPEIIPQCSVVFSLLVSYWVCYFQRLHLHIMTYTHIILLILFGSIQTTNYHHFFFLIVRRPNGYFLWHFQKIKAHTKLQIIKIYFVFKITLSLSKSKMLDRQVYLIVIMWVLRLKLSSLVKEVTTLLWI